MYYLAVNCDFKSKPHESSACLFEDGQLLDFIEEERLTKNKHSEYEYPNLSISNILYRNNLSISQIDYCNLSVDILKNIFPLAKKLPKQFEWKNKVSHHDTHTFDSFYKSGFDKAAVLIIDGSDNNKYCVTLAEIDDSNYIVLKRIPVIFSLGNLFNAATKYCGLGSNSEGKLMGLASYGKDLNKRILEFDKNTCEIKFTQTAKLITEGNNEEYISLFCKEFYPYIKKNDRIDIMQYKDFAATIQANFNEIVLSLANWLFDNSHYKMNLILGGGCIQNIIANDLLCTKTKFKNIYCSSIPHDAGSSFGTCYGMLRENSVKPEPLTNRGLLFSQKIYGYNDYYQVSSEYEIQQISMEKIVEKLINNQIIGWFQEGSEYGPRALGHRSLLASPVNKDMSTKLNNLKHRENWRPLAPIIPEELFEYVIETNGNLSLYEYMLRSSSIKEEWKHKVSAVCHVDGTTRPQLLKKRTNETLYNLIMEFYQKTGIPCLVNTSLNKAGKPIVETPADFMSSFDDDNIDIIWDGKWITIKN